VTVDERRGGSAAALAKPFGAPYREAVT